MYGSMKTVLYARVSTSDQSCDMQLRELKDYANRRGFELAREYWTPVGVELRPVAGVRPAHARCPPPAL